MINPIERGGFNNFKTFLSRKKIKTKYSGKEVDVIVDISTSSKVASERINKNRLEQLKRLIKEGNYPLDRQKLAEKIVNFLLDGE